MPVQGVLSVATPWQSPQPWSPGTAAQVHFSRAEREVPETSTGAHGWGFLWRAASARAALLPAAAAPAAGMQVPFVSSSEKFIRRRQRRRRGNRGTVPALAARK